MPSRPAFPRVSWTELLRDFFPLQQRPLEVLLRWQRRFGPTFWLPGALPRLVLSAPEDVRHVLVARQDNYWKVGNFALLRDVLGEGILTSNGPLHDRQRRAWMPHFQKNVLSEVGPRASRHTDELTRAWKPGDAVELGGLFARVAVALLGDVLLGVDLRGEAEKIFRSGLAIQTYVGTGVFTPWPGFFRRFRARSFARARDAVVGVAEGLL
ncbi:MAG TPA: cytochrome P450, partial [Elusimicrobiota bacterium]|nr:cytochrome P450 [Elusimicrobiota bacterium]